MDPARRTRAATALAVLTAAVLAAGCNSVHSNGTPATLPVRSPPTTASNKAAARRDAARMVRLFVPPPGAQPLRSEPAPLVRLARMFGESGHPTGLADRHGFWRVRSSVLAVARFEKSHAPPRSSAPGVGWIGSSLAAVNRELTFSLPAIKRRIWRRELDVTVVELPRRWTAIRVDARSTWVVARPASEQVPAGVREITIHTPLKSRPVDVTDPSKVRRIVRWFDALEIVQPWALKIVCPAVVGTSVSFGFRAAGGAVLARAVAPAANRPAGTCNPIELTIRGHRQKPLVGDFVARVQRLLDVRLIPRRGA